MRPRRADGLLEKLTAAPAAATLKKGQTWRMLLDEPDGAASNLSKAVLADWRRSREPSSPEIRPLLCADAWRERPRTIERWGSTRFCTR